MKLLFSAAILVLLTAQSLADQTDRPVETFLQNVDIQRNPRFAAGGMKVNQQIHYQIQSSFEVYAADQQGNRQVIQTVTEATLVNADPLSRATFAQSLAEMQGLKFVYKLNPSARIVAMQGHKGNTKAVNVQQPTRKGVLVSTVIDEDGWKELAELTLFQPPTDRRRARSFVRKTTHDWGELGSWYGSTDFRGRDFGRNGKRFGYLHRLEYIPPNRQPGKPSNLPFEIKGAQFRIYEGAGEIQYDDKQQRVTRVHEVFDARGTVATNFLGVPSTVDVAETQVFTITITGRRVLGSEDTDDRPDNQ